MSFYQDDEVLGRILHLLLEDKRTDKIEGIIFTTAVVKYGGDMAAEEATEIYKAILDWFEEKEGGSYGVGLHHPIDDAHEIQSKRHLVYKKTDHLPHSSSVKNMKKRLLLSLIAIGAIMVSCNQETESESSVAAAEQPDKRLAQVKEEQYDIKEDSLTFNSATIENFDRDGRSMQVFWMDEDRDTILRFYRKYASDQQLIGAEYFEEGDTLPNRDTVYLDGEGRKVEASLNADNQITWKSTIHADAQGNEVLRSYENGKGDYRGFDSLYFDDKNRVIKGFYENAKGKRYSIKTYEYLSSDEQDQWLERNMFVDDTLRQKHKRILTYYE
ncbi:MAG: hypothetical protein AAFP19_13440 [Bacteroidota bacterium]